MKSAFDSETPSVFIICSPFQALCLVSAIRNLKLTDYQVVVIPSVRFTQVKTVLDRFGISFEIKDLGWHRWRMRWYRFSSLFHRRNKYKRLFVGDFRSINLLYLGLQYISDGADIVYLDDGNASIPLFDGSRTSLPLKHDTTYAKWLTQSRNISFMKYFYSIYADFPDSKYEIKKNSLHILLSPSKEESSSCIYFIGTNTVSYCASLNITVEAYMQVLCQIISYINQKYEEPEILYIPHGKDVSEEIKSLCKENNIKYQKLDMPVELYFVNQARPLAVYGFGSSALYNIKQMFPKTIVYNIFITPKAGGDTKARKVSISNFYERNGIIAIKKEV